MEKLNWFKDVDLVKDKYLKGQTIEEWVTLEPKRTNNVSTYRQDQLNIFLLQQGGWLGRLRWEEDGVGKGSLDKWTSQSYVVYAFVGILEG